MKVLLTGCSGQLGNSIKNLTGADFELITPNSQDLNFLEPKKLMQKLNFFSPNIIINAAAYTQVDNAEQNKDIALKINGEAPLILAEYSYKRDIPLFHFSTDYVFDGKKSTPYTEEDSPNPINTYGESKLFGDLNIFNNAEKFIIFRTSWVYNKHYGKNFFRTMQKLFREKEEIRVVDDQIGSPTNTTYLANACLSFIKNYYQGNDMSKLWGLYNISGDSEVSWYDFALKIFNNEKKNNLKTKKIIPIKTSDLPIIAKRPEYSCLDNALIKKTLLNI